MASNMIPGSEKSASVPTLSDILMSITDVKGAVACALGKIEHADSDATGTLTIALGEIERTQEQIERIQSRAKEVTAGTAVAQPAQPADESDADAPLAVCTRIATLRERMFGPMAAVDVASQAIRIEDDCNVHRLLADAYRQFDAIALELWGIAGNAEPEETDAAGAEVTP